MTSDAVSRLLALALEEDIGSGDVTSESLIDENLTATAEIVCREDIVVCGQKLAAEVFAALSPDIEYQILIDDGQRADISDRIAKVSGPFRQILTAERTALNFLQRLSAISTKTAQAVQLASPGVQVLDTRKTTPGWRELEKYAVKMGGGSNHRTGLFDAVLIKNNHIDAVGGDVSLAVKKSRANNPGLKIEVEVRNEAELRAALSELPDAILLDNMSVVDLRYAVSIVRGSDAGKQIILEASGGITNDNISEISATGVDAVSMGGLTHSVSAVDLALHFLSN